jgi:hypothetical protein
MRFVVRSFYSNSRDNHVLLIPACEVLSVPGHATMLITGRPHHRCSAALRRSEAAVEEASDQPGGDAYLYAVRDEHAYLQTDDEKPVFVHPRLTLPSSNAGSAGSPIGRCRLSRRRVPGQGSQQLRQRDADLHLQRVRCQVRGATGQGSPRGSTVTAALAKRARRRAGEAALQAPPESTQPVTFKQWPSHIQRPTSRSTAEYLECQECRRKERRSLILQP